MAVVFNITDGTNTVDLTSATDFHLLHNYNPRIATPTGDGSIPPYIVEVIPVIVNCASADDLATTLQKFHTLQLEAAQYWADPTFSTVVWLHHKLSAETYERRAFVKSLSLEFDTQLGSLFDAAPDITEGRLARLLVERHPYWERTSADTEATASDVTGIGGAYDYTVTAGDIVGDVPARIYYLCISSNTVSTVGRYTWIGFRSADKHGTLANFIQTWEIEKGAMGTDTAITDPDATASDSKSTETTFTIISTWTSRSTIQLSNITAANEGDFYGQFRMLMRAKVDASTTAEAYITQCYPGEINYPQKGEVTEITATSWTWYDMGLSTIPLRDIQAVTTTILPATGDKNQVWEIWARRTAGAGSLHLDCIVMMPVDEYFLYLERTYIGSTNDRLLYIAASPHDRLCGVSYQEGAAGDPISSLGLISSSGYGVPVGDGRLYFIVADSNRGTAIANTYDLKSRMMQRWNSLRGSEA